MQNDKEIFDSFAAYLQEWQEIPKRIQEKFDSLIKNHHNKIIHYSLQPVTHLERKLQKNFETVATTQDYLKRFSPRVPVTAIIPQLDYYTSQFNQNYLESINKLLDSAFDKLRKYFRELPPKIQNALLLLGKHGWYFDLNMPIPVLMKLAELLSEGNIDLVKKLLCEYFETRLDDIEHFIINRFPKRAKIIKAAINAYRRREYELAIPVLLIQADGICKEVMNQHLFMKKNKKPCTAIYIKEKEKLLDEISSALLSPFSYTLPINLSEYDRGDDFSELNRHMVLHGESIDYATKINSLKAISLINYIVKSCDLIRKKES